MKLKKIFQNAGEIIFNVAGDLKKQVTIVSTQYDGMSDPVESKYTVYAIQEKNIQDNIKNLSFNKLFQTNDILIYVLGGTVPSLDTNDYVIMDNIKYAIFGCQIDTANAVWTIGLR